MTRIGVTKRIMHAPVVENSMGAVSCDIIKGFTKKGKFEIQSYRNELGRLVRRDFNFFENGKKIKQQRLYGYAAGDSKNRAVVSLFPVGNKFQREYERCFLFDQSNSSNDVWMLERKNNEVSEHQTIAYLSPGEKPKSLSYITSYDGERPVFIEKEGVEKKGFPIINSEYLPIITSVYSHNVEQKIKHISAMQEKKYQLDGVIPPVERVPQDLLDESANGDCDIKTGQIRISNDCYLGSVLLNILAHEYKHASDFSDVHRLESNADTFSILPKKIIKEMKKEYPEEIEFMEKSIQKGVIKYNSKLGKVVKKVEEHLKAREFVPYEQRFHEKRAFNASKKEIERYNSYWDSLKKYFNANFAPKYEL